MHRYRNILLLIPLIVFLFFMNGCEKNKRVHSIKVIENEPLAYSLNGFSYDNYKVEVTYDNGETEVIPLEESMISSYDQLSFYKVGKHTINVTYKKATTSFEIVVDKNSFSEDIKFEDLTLTYDGKPHKLEVVGDLPNGTTVIYKQGNEFTNAGIYDLEASLICDGYYVKTLNATLKINRADYDLSDLTFNDVEAVYDGFNKNVVIVGEIPAGLSVTYQIEDEDHNVGTGNQATDAGQYHITAIFTNNNSNYNAVKSMSATLTIHQREYDLSYVILEDQEFTYDAEEHKLEIAYSAITQTLPKDVQYKYYYDGVETTGGKINAGVYEVEVRFTSLNKNYTVSKGLNATLTINPAVIDISNIVFNSNKYVFEENVTRTIAYDPTTLPQFVHFVGYSSNENETIVQNIAFYNAKKYTVYAHFASDNGNFILSNKGIVEASLEIVKKEIYIQNVIFEDKYFDASATSQKITFKIRGESGDTEEGPIPEMVRFEYSPNNDELKPEGMYNISLRFYTDDPNYTIANSIFTAIVTVGGAA